MGRVARCPMTKSLTKSLASNPSNLTVTTNCQDLKLTAFLSVKQRSISSISIEAERRRPKRFCRFLPATAVAQRLKKKGKTGSIWSPAFRAQQRGWYSFPTGVKPGEMAMRTSRHLHMGAHLPPALPQHQHLL